MGLLLAAAAGGAVLTGCAPDLSDRVSELEAQVAEMSDSGDVEAAASELSDAAAAVSAELEGHRAALDEIGERVAAVEFWISDMAATAGLPLPLADTILTGPFAEVEFDAGCHLATFSDTGELVDGLRDMVVGLVIFAETIKADADLIQDDGIVVLVNDLIEFRDSMRDIADVMAADGYPYAADAMWWHADTANSTLEALIEGQQNQHQGTVDIAIAQMEAMYDEGEQLAIAFDRPC